MYLSILNCNFFKTCIMIQKEYTKCETLYDKKMDLDYIL